MQSFEKTLPMNDENEMITYLCKLFGNKFAKKPYLIQHELHSDIKYHCGVCNYSTGRKGALETHKKRVHEGIKYSCMMCNYKASTQGQVRGHQESFHEGKKVQL